MMLRTGRYPVDELAARGKPTGQDAIWAAIRALSPSGEAFDREAILLHLAARKGRSAAARETVRDYVEHLCAAGILLRLDTEAPTYRLADDPGPETPRVRADGSCVLQGAGREAMWRTMKILGDFTLDDLVVIGSTEIVRIGRVDAKYYLKWLVKAGYVAVVSRPANTALPTVYRLLRTRNTGPKPPQIQRSHQLFDPNLRRVVWKSGTETL